MPSARRKRLLLRKPQRRARCDFLTILTLVFDYFRRFLRLFSTDFGWFDAQMTVKAKATKARKTPKGPLDMSG